MNLSPPAQRASMKPPPPSSEIAEDEAHRRIDVALCSSGKVLGKVRQCGQVIEAYR
jgi:hypothetical protein